MKFSYLFGPVPSRRLGISLGIDLFPKNICTFNCVYCECGRTEQQTLERHEFVPTKDVIDEIDKYLEEYDKPDFITFAGSGEPTLHTGIGDIINHVKKNYPDVKVALLTNATLLFDTKVREEIVNLDIILPTINGVLPESVTKIARPLKSYDISKIIDGLIEFRKEFKGEIWLAYFVVDEINTSEAELKLAKEAILKIKPDRVQLNTVDRPPTEDWVSKANKDTLENIVKSWNLEEENGILVEIISKYRSRREIASYKSDTEAAILNTISRRPCTVEDISHSLGLHINEVTKYIDILEKESKIRLQIEERGVFYAKKHDENKR